MEIKKPKKKTIFQKISESADDFINKSKIFI